MHVCHGTLRGLAMHMVPPDAHYAGAAAVFRVVLHNARRSVRYGIGMAVRGSGQWAWTDVPAEGTSTVEIAFQPERRGLHPVPPLTAETRFPARHLPRVDGVAARRADAGLPRARSTPATVATRRAAVRGRRRCRPAQRAHGAGEYDGVRAYRRGDPLKLVVWKKAARAQAAGSEDLVSRDTQQTQREELWLDAQATGLADGEARISRLCAWVLMADRLGVDYGVRVQGRVVKPSQGEAHRRACLEALAQC
jgi:uncharacterized protein (DUF58 family)